MNRPHSPDWNPRAPGVLDRLIPACDDMRRRCPVAYSDYLQWSVFRHEDVMRALRDHETFGNAVSSRRSVPNGMDPPEHTAYRRLIEPYFSAPRVAAFEPACRRIADALMETLPAHGEVDMADLAQDFALRVQCAFMGWPESLHGPLREWTRANQAATLAGDREAMAAVALAFDGHIRAQLDARRAASAAGAAPGDDPTARLLRETLDGRALSDEEIVSIVRNWTVGELSTIAACIGIVAHRLATHDDLQQQLRGRPELLGAAIDEMLRIDAPLIANRRIVAKEAELGGHRFAPGDRITLLWASANRDEAVFGDPDEFRLDRDPSLNLLYGAGIHVCPGAPLARMELRVAVQSLLARTRRIAAVPGRAPVRARYPVGGFASLLLRIERA